MQIFLTLILLLLSLTLNTEALAHEAVAETPSETEAPASIGAGVSALSMASSNISDYVDISTFGVVVDIRYNSVNNFMGANVYNGFNTPYLHRIAAEKFKKAVDALKAVKPQWKFIIFDALRPRSVQYELWRVKPDTRYVARPASGSMHNYGFAIDLSLVDENGDEVDMGTPYDTFSEKAHTQNEEDFLTPEQIENREILRNVMGTHLEDGFRGITTEWWHFDALPRAEVRSRYRIVETIEELTN